MAEVSVVEYKERLGNLAYSKLCIQQSLELLRQTADAGQDSRELIRLVGYAREDEDTLRLQYKAILPSDADLEQLPGLDEHFPRIV